MGVDATLLHRIIGMLGGKKLLALVAGIILWCLNKYAHITPEQVTGIVSGGSDLAVQAQTSSGWQIVTLISGYIGFQGILDAFTKGGSSSVALVTKTGVHAEGAEGN